MHLVSTKHLELADHCGVKLTRFRQYVSGLSIPPTLMFHRGRSVIDDLARAYIPCRRSSLFVPLRRLFALIITLDLSRMIVSTAGQQRANDSVIAIEVSCQVGRSSSNYDKSDIPLRLLRERSDVYARMNTRLSTILYSHLNFFVSFKGIWLFVKLVANKVWPEGRLAYCLFSKCRISMGFFMG